MSKLTYTLTMTNLTLEKTKEIAGEGGELLWDNQGEHWIAYPTDEDSPAIITQESK